ncbi:zinc-finger of transposase IS204/IS1001/IS1096/IS1165 [Modestobacter sp. DSM 44400]|nr:zinc-finger of transposase IS204/IS1001/IS1096/IS1165 [Modestobacter sp. DSM 44400]
MVHVVTDDETAAACPACGVLSTAARQRRVTRPRDVAYGEVPVAVRWRTAQYACRERLCPRQAFTEQIAEVPARARVTGRARRAAGAAVAAGASVSAAVRAHGLSWPTVHDMFIAHAEALLAGPGPVRVLGIDETRRGRPVWTQDSVTGRWTVSERFETTSSTWPASRDCSADRRTQQGRRHRLAHPAASTGTGKCRTASQRRDVPSRSNPRAWCVTAAA